MRFILSFDFECWAVGLGVFLNIATPGVHDIGLQVGPVFVGVRVGSPK